MKHIQYRTQHIIQFFIPIDITHITFTYPPFWNTKQFEFHYVTLKIWNRNLNTFIISSDIYSIHFN